MPKFHLSVTCSFNIYSYYAYLCRVWVKAILNKRKYPKYYSNQISKHFDNQKRVFKGEVFCTALRDSIPPQKHGSNRVKLFFYALFKKIVVTEFLLSYWGNHSLIFGLNNLSKFLRILRNNLVLLKVCLENQVSCTSLITLK